MSDGVGGEVGKVKAVVGDGCARPLKLNANEKKKVQKKQTVIKTQEKKQKTTENYQSCKFDGNKNGGNKKKKKC